MARVALLTLHGMGITLKDYADVLRSQLRARLGAGRDDVALEAIYYQGILQSNERAVWRRTLAGSKVRRENLRTFVLSGLADAIGLESRKEQPGSAYEQAQLEIARRLLAARDQMGANGPVVFLTQSLGCQVLSNYLYDAQLPEGRANAGIWRDIQQHATSIAGHPLAADEIEFLRGSTIHCWITTSCSIPAFVAADPCMRIRPIRPPAAGFRWMNIYDPNDVLGWPLRPLGSGYEKLVEDRAINLCVKDPVMAADAGAYSHDSYWAHEDVMGPLVGILKALLGRTERARDLTVTGCL